MSVGLSTALFFFVVCFHFCFLEKRRPWRFHWWQKWQNLSSSCSIITCSTVSPINTYIVPSFSQDSSRLFKLSHSARVLRSPRKSTVSFLFLPETKAKSNLLSSSSQNSRLYFLFPLVPRCNYVNSSNRVIDFDEHRASTGPSARNTFCDAKAAWHAWTKL